MRQRSNATTASGVPARRSRAGWRSRLMQRAPGPETPPEPRDKAGAQGGMIILIVAGVVFWAAVAAVVVYLLRR